MIVVVCDTSDSTAGSTNVKVFTLKCYPKDVESRQPVGSISLIGSLVTILPSYSTWSTQKPTLTILTKGFQNVRT
ncbi:hypothetical protein M0802_008344 [Mischocyttarus mexicanus]|nr:hypothetical protein M0802_008344 [Mischocyttarus mexicanus]